MMKFSKSLILAVAFGSVAAQAAKVKKTTNIVPESPASAPAASEPALVSAPTHKGPLLVGWKAHSITDLTTVSGLNALYGLNDRTWVGGTFGMGNDFDNLLLGGEVRYDLNHYGDHALYADGFLGFVKVGDKKYIPLNALIGFDMRLFEHIHASLAFGLQLGFKDTGDTFATTTSPLANIGFAWLL